MDDPEYKPYVDSLLESCMVRKMSSEEHANLDTESYEEVRAAAMDLDLDSLPDLDA